MAQVCYDEMNAMRRQACRFLEARELVCVYVFALNHKCRFGAGTNVCHPFRVIPRVRLTFKNFVSKKATR